MLKVCKATKPYRNKEFTSFGLQRLRALFLDVVVADPCSVKVIHEGTSAINIAAVLSKSAATSSV